MANQKLRKISKRHRRQAREACEALREAAEAAGCVLPSLDIDPAESITGQTLVDLGRARPESVLNLVDVLWAGLAAIAAEAPPVVPLFRPKVGDLVVDTVAVKVGTYKGATDTGWSLSPWPVAGSPWTADPLNVRVATTNERVRADMEANPTAVHGKRVG
ncbi:hypothetical protein PUR61_28085 [Streptomyces sp. BE20]|uniref:hypothetical protein n=1 Tax=Streptomyces sp. BE20 TaxID=3002525 RepID=UPI002E79F3FE|nr:hypothetical protein [Streptomyces sp. BE20]MEE1826024.1 hypothetical protein [Streptomyces sp. BE20]